MEIFLAHFPRYGKSFSTLWKNRPDFSTVWKIRIFPKGPSRNQDMCIPS